MAQVYMKCSFSDPANHRPGGASTKTTEQFYVDDVPKDTLEGMNRLAALFSDCSTTKQ
jgi:hypothetical protein